MTIKWPNVIFALFLLLTLVLLIKDGGSTLPRFYQLFDTLLGHAAQDPIYALGLAGMGLIALLGCLRLLTRKS